MAEIRWSHKAEQWLKEIYEYISEDNPTTAAEKVATGIYDKAQKLSDFPQLSHKYREEPEGGYPHPPLWSLPHCLLN